MSRTTGNKEEQTRCPAFSLPPEAIKCKALMLLFLCEFLIWNGRRIMLMGFVGHVTGLPFTLIEGCKSSLQRTRRGTKFSMSHKHVQLNQQLSAAKAS